MKPGSFRIESVTEEHIAGFNHAVDLVAREKKYLARTEAPSVGESEAFVRDNIRSGNPHFVAMAGAEVVGWCDIVRMKKAAFSHCGTLGMGVVEAFRGQGIGLALIRAALAGAQSIGLERVELEVFHTNTGAIALYEKVGFHTEGTKARAARLEGRYLDTLQMALFLDAYKEPATSDGRETR